MIGACATAGGIQAIRNWFDHDEFRAAVYPEPEYVESLAEARPVADFVAVDAELRGCPISPDQLREYLVALVTGRRPQLPTKPSASSASDAASSASPSPAGSPVSDR